PARLRGESRYVSATLPREAGKPSGSSARYIRLHRAARVIWSPTATCANLSARSGWIASRRPSCRNSGAIPLRHKERRVTGGQGDQDENQQNDDREGEHATDQHQRLPLWRGLPALLAATGRRFRLHRRFGREFRDRHRIVVGEGRQSLLYADGSGCRALLNPFIPTGRLQFGRAPAWRLDVVPLHQLVEQGWRQLDLLIAIDGLREVIDQRGRQGDRF